MSNPTYEAMIKELMAGPPKIDRATALKRLKAAGLIPKDYR